MIKGSLLSSYVDSDVAADPRAALNFTVDESLGGLKFHSVMGNGMLFNRDLKTPTESEDKAMLVTDQSFAKVKIDHKILLCESKIKQYPDDYSLIESKRCMK